LEALLDSRDLSLERNAVRDNKKLLKYLEQIASDKESSIDELAGIRSNAQQVERALAPIAQMK